MDHAASTVRIIAAEGEAVGTGILAGSEHILTYTHVVTAAQVNPDRREVVETAIRFDMPPASQTMGLAVSPDSQEK